MESFFAQSPSSNPENIHEIAYVVICSLAILSVIIIITCGSHLCTTRVFLQTDLSQQNTSSEQQQFAKQGLDEATISTYPKILYSEVKLYFGSSTSTCCSICLADYKETDVLLLLPNCAHVFHLHCVKQWLRLHPTCPVCRNLPLPSSVVIPIDHVMSLQNSEDQLER